MTTQQHPTNPQADGTGAAPSALPQHDAAYKALFTFPEMMIALIRSFVLEPFVRQLDFATLERVSGEFVTMLLRLGFSDLIWRLRWKNRPGWCYLILMVEFQSSPQRLIALRLYNYVALVLQRLADEGGLPLIRGKLHLPLILPIVVYNGKARWTVPTRLSRLFVGPKSLADYLPELRYVLVDVHRIALNRPELRDNLMALVARLERAYQLVDVDAALEALDQNARKTENPRLQEVIVTWVRSRFDQLGVPGDWKQNLNNLGEVRGMLSEYMATWEAKAVARGARKGRSKGLAEGHSRGLAEGELATQKKNLREYLRARFGETPQAAGDFLDQETNVDRLWRLTQAAWRAASLEAFLAVLDKEQHGTTH